VLRYRHHRGRRTARAWTSSQTQRRHDATAPNEREEVHTWQVLESLCGCSGCDHGNPGSLRMARWWSGVRNGAAFLYRPLLAANDRSV